MNMEKMYSYILTSILLCSSFIVLAQTPDTTIVETKITMDDPDDSIHVPSNTLTNSTTGMNRITIENGSGLVRVVNGANTSFVARPLVKTSFSRKGPYALIYELPKRDSITYEQEVDRMETSVANENMSVEAATESAHYSAFSIYLPSGYDLVNDWLVVHQWHQSTPESPPIAFLMAPGYFARLNVSILYGGNKSSTTQVHLTRLNDTCNCEDKYIDLPRDKWIDFVVRWKFDPYGTTGETIVWMKELDAPTPKKIFEYHGKIGFTNVISPSINEKIGIYRKGDYLSAYKVIYDEFKRGKSFDAVKAW